jgi:hypothetical protein
MSPSGTKATIGAISALPSFAAIPALSRSRTSIQVSSSTKSDPPDSIGRGAFGSGFAGPNFSWASRMKATGIRILMVLALPLSHVGFPYFRRPLPPRQVRIDR